MKLSKEEIKELQELNLQMGVSIGMIESGINVRLHAEKYANAFTRTGQILSKNFPENNARIVGDIEVDENNICTPVNY